MALIKTIQLTGAQTGELAELGKKAVETYFADAPGMVIGQALADSFIEADGGDVLTYANFAFVDGETAKKLIAVMVEAGYKQAVRP